MRASTQIGPARRQDSKRLRRSGDTFLERAGNASAGRERRSTQAPGADASGSFSTFSVNDGTGRRSCPASGGVGQIGTFHLPIHESKESRLPDKQECADSQVGPCLTHRRQRAIADQDNDQAHGLIYLAGYRRQLSRRFAGGGVSARGRSRTSRICGSKQELGGRGPKRITVILGRLTPAARWGSERFEESASLRKAFAAGLNGGGLSVGNPLDPSTRPGLRKASDPAIPSNTQGKSTDACPR